MKRFLTTGLLAGAVLATGVACSSDRLTVPNYQSPTQASALADPVAAVPLLATGVLRDDRGNMAGFVGGVGILGREAYNYMPTEGRNTSGWLTSDVNNSTSFGGVALWTGYYGALRDIYQLRTVANGAKTGVFTDAQKNAINGFVDTEEALQLLYLIDARNELGAVVEIKADPTQLAPFVSRDSVFKYITTKLTTAVTELGAGGSSFPFKFHAGFAGFDTPANFAKFTNGLLARVDAYRASMGVGGCTAKSTTCYQAVLSALNASFINPGGSLKTGPFEVFSSAAGDATNGIARQTTTNWVAHAHADSGVALRPDGSKDLRFTSKVTTIPSKSPSTAILGLKTTWAYGGLYALQTDPISIIRNEELILLRAEAEYYTGDQAGALNDINLVRTTSGGLAPRGAFTSESDFLDELLYNRRESLMFEGHRWIDVRRFGRLSTLPIDSNDPAAKAIAGFMTHVVVSHLPIPQGECLIRANSSLKGPGC